MDLITLVVGIVLGFLLAFGTLYVVEWHQQRRIDKGLNGRHEYTEAE